jgi:hypothetical protein
MQPERTTTYGRDPHMDMTRSESKSTTEWWSISAAVSAAIFNVLSSALMNYQMYIVDLWIQQESIAMNYPLRDRVTDHSHIFFQFFFLTPMFVVATFRRYPAFTFSYALILFMIFAGRLYYLVQLYRVGLDAVSKFDAPQLLWTILGTISSVIVAICVIAYSASFIRKTIRAAKTMAEKIEVFARLSLISVLALAQTPPAYPIEVSTPRASTMNNCNASNDDFGADLKRLSDTIKQRQDIPQEFLERHFAGCTIENARKLLVKNGFAADELGPEFDNTEPKKVIPRRMMAAKGIRRIGQLGSFNCRIILQTDTSKRVKAEGFFYFDGP